MTIFIIYTTDTWHMTDSKVVIGVRKSISRAVALCKSYTKIDRETPLSDDDISFLQAHLQTQGRDVNFLIEQWDTTWGVDP